MTSFKGGNKVRIKIPNLWCVWIASIYIFSQQFLYLLPESRFLQIISYFLIIILFICVYLKNPILKISWFSILMLSTVFLSMLAAIVEKNIYMDVSFFKSFLQQSQWWIYSLLFLSIVRLLRIKKIKESQIINTIVLLGIIQVSIGIVQYLLSDILTFVHVSSNLRYGQPRYYYPIVLMVLLLFISIDRVLQGSQNTKKQLLIIALCFIEIVVVQKFRSTLMGVLGAMVIGFIFWKKKIVNKFIWTIIGGSVLTIIILNSHTIQDTINSLLYNSDNSLGMRNTLINFLCENIKQHPLLGLGWVSSEAAYSYAASAYRNAYGWNVFAFADGGIFSFMFSYGIGGLVWVILLWGLMIRRGYKIIQAKRKYFYFLFPIYMLITMYIDIHWYIHDQFFVLAVFCALEEQQYYRC